MTILISKAVCSAHGDDWTIYRGTCTEEAGTRVQGVPLHLDMGCRGALATRQGSRECPSTGQGVQGVPLHPGRECMGAPATRQGCIRTRAGGALAPRQGVQGCPRYQAGVQGVPSHPGRWCSGTHQAENIITNPRFRCVIL